MKNNNFVLVTGGAGYIGSHTCVELINAGYNIIVVDSLCNSKLESIRRVEMITGKSILFFNFDLRDADKISDLLKSYKCQAVMHFAGLKSVNESVSNSLNYYDYNVLGFINLLKSMQSCRVNKLVVSSSATVYGNPIQLPISESHPLATTNPYARTKLVIEEILRDLYHSQPHWHIAILRYFNPAGAHPSGMIGEDPQGIPNNLLPYVCQVAIGRVKHLLVYGNDYDTCDGTGVRDYIHVVDLAIGHLKALENLTSTKCITLNLGCGNGISVMQLIREFEHVSGRSIPFKIVGRRNGDVGECYADPTLAQNLLNWKATKNLNDMCVDAWRWQTHNPNGYN